MPTANEVLTTAATGIARLIVANATYAQVYQDAERRFYAELRSRQGSIPARVQTGPLAGHLTISAAAIARSYAPPVVAAAREMQAARNTLEPIWGDFTYIKDNPNVYGLDATAATALRDSYARGQFEITKSTTQLQQYRSSAYYEVNPDSVAWFRAVFTGGPRHAEVMQNQGDWASKRGAVGSLMETVMRTFVDPNWSADSPTPRRQGGGLDIPDALKLVLGLGAGVVGALVVIKYLDSRAE